MTQEILNLLNEEYQGKTFIYQSKYGGYTEIICERVYMMHSVIFDDATTEKLGRMIKKSKGIPVDIRGSIKVKEEASWRAELPELFIHSTKGQTYDFNECYLLMRKDEI
jgi:hypothetical protein